MRALLVAAALLLAGCGAAPDRPDSTPSASPQEPATFDGEAALARVAAFALREDGSPRFRIPGTAGQREGIDHLWNATDVPDWTRRWHNLTGEDYFALDRSIVAAYGPGTPYCPPEDEARARTLPFHNLLAVRRSGTAQAPLVLLAAHWDSQMHSDYDPDPAKRDLPDPGANDGASGVGLLLEMMRHLEGVALPFDVGILFLDGEDGFFDCYPLAGSLHLAAHPPEPVAALLLLDMVGDPGARYPRESFSAQSARPLVDIVWRHGRELGPEHFVNRSAQILDDHVPFARAGVPAIDIIDAGRPGFPPQWDTTGDTVDKLDARMLGLVGDVLVATLQDPAFSDWLAARPGTP